nr:PREDICTED: insulin-like growth factor-binding protein 2 [Equus przewalskii]
MPGRKRKRAWARPGPFRIQGLGRLDGLAQHPPAASAAHNARDYAEGRSCRAEKGVDSGAPSRGALAGPSEPTPLGLNSKGTTKYQELPSTRDHLVPGTTKYRGLPSSRDHQVPDTIKYQTGIGDLCQSLGHSCLDVSHLCLCHDQGPDRPWRPVSLETGPGALLPFLSADNGDDHSEGGLVENHVDGTANTLGGGGGTGRKPLKSGMKELAVYREKVSGQHRQMGRGGKHHHVVLEEPKKLRPPSARTPCQQELDQVLERISTMRLPDERGPLEHLYSLHIPNCDKHGLYNLKQCKMSLNGQRGECWCVNPNTGKLIQGAPTIRGDPECHLFYNEQQEARGVHTQRMQ